MQRKRIIIGMIILGFLGIGLKIFLYAKRDSYIIDKSSKISIADTIEAVVDRPFDEYSINVYFAENFINRHTLRFFEFLDIKIPNIYENENDYYNEVQGFLEKELPGDRAAAMLDLYKKYRKYLEELSYRLQQWDYPPKGKADYLSFLFKLQDFRREYFGERIADILFGAELKSTEYPLRRSMIVDGSELFAEEKLERLDRLNHDMWGDEADKCEDFKSSWNKYQESLKIYQRDLNELTYDERKEKIRELRSEIFTPEEVQRLDVVDADNEERVATEKNYFAAKKKLLNDSSITDDQKMAKVDDLRVATFGDYADKMKIREELKDSLKIRVEESRESFEKQWGKPKPE